MSIAEPTVRPAPKPKQLLRKSAVDVYRSAILAGETPDDETILAGGGFLTDGAVDAETLSSRRNCVEHIKAAEEVDAEDRPKPAALDENMLRPVSDFPTIGELVVHIELVRQQYERPNEATPVQQEHARMQRQTRQARLSAISVLIATASAELHARAVSLNNQRQQLHRTITSRPELATLTRMIVGVESEMDSLRRGKKATKADFAGHSVPVPPAAQRTELAELKEKLRKLESHLPAAREADAANKRDGQASFLLNEEYTTILGVEMRVPENMEWASDKPDAPRIGPRRPGRPR